MESRLQENEWRTRERRVNVNTKRRFMVPPRERARANSQRERVYFIPSLLVFAKLTRRQVLAADRNQPLFSGEALNLWLHFRYKTVPPCSLYIIALTAGSSVLQNTVYLKREHLLNNFVNCILVLNLTVES